MNCIKWYNKFIMRKIWQVILILLITSQCIYADDKDPNGPGCPNEPNTTSEQKDPNDPNGLNDPNTLDDPNALIDPNIPFDPNDPNELLSTKWKSIISILQNKKFNQQTKEEYIKKTVSPYFDFPLMAKLALGREHWPKLTTAQSEKFTGLFTERLKTSYGKKLALYKDEKVVIKPKMQKNNTVYIPTELVSQDRKVDILYKIRRLDNGWKIYDVEIQGVSVLLTYRSQFDDILSRGTVEDLLARLEKPPDD